MKKIVFISIILVALFVIIYFAFNGSKPVDPRGVAYAGSATCIKCHGDLYKSYLHTAHYMASMPADVNTVHGSFAKNFNTFKISDSQKIVMEKLDSGMYQSYYKNGKLMEHHRFDIVLGGVKGESYLFWNDNGLNQLPISYFTKQVKWLMSPGYAPGVADFTRIITSRCIECHGSYIAELPTDVQKIDAPEQFDKRSLVYGVDCERCHGPGAQHVEFQANNPGVKTARYIASFSSLPQARKIDVCGECHSGNKSQMLRSTFFFKPGDTLANFKLPDFARAIDTSHLDVHGNQVQLLESSKCFIHSKMDCGTCHDTHQNQRGNIALYTQKCLGCHSLTNHNYCKIANTVDAKLISSNCIQCHMPALFTKVILTSNINQTSSTEILVRSHHIAIYPQETKKILMMLAK
jgi:hypothetical protein